MVEATTLYLAGAAVAALLGFAWLALAMDEHWRQVHGRGEPQPRARRALRILGGLGLLGSLGLCLLADRPSMAVLVWVMLLAGGALLIALALAWKPGALRVLWPGGRS
jgi:hypothetical protein